MGRGALVFKGEKHAVSSGGGCVKQRHKKRKLAEAADGGGGGISSRGGGHGTAAVVATATALSTNDAMATSTIAQSTTATATSAQVPQMKRGTGMITTSGSVVSGHDGSTRFMTEIGVGDALLVDIVKGNVNNKDAKNTAPAAAAAAATATVSTKQEMRIVTMRLSDVSLNLSSAFSTSLSVPTQFFYISKPKTIQQREESTKARERQAKAKHDEERHTTSTSAAIGGAAEGELVYRERTEHGNCRTKRMQVASNDGHSVNRSDLLDLRTKKTSDKYC